MGRLLIQNFPLSKLYFEPAATSFQLAFSRLGKPWQNTQWISLHGRDPISFEKVIKKLPSSLVVLTDSNRGGAKEVYELLHSLRLEGKYDFWTFERLGYQNERIIKINSIQDFPIDLDPLHLVILFEKEKPLIKSKDLPLFGIDDSIFLQYSDCPGLMTKREIRVQLLSELNLPKQGVIWDIGSGVGSIGLEALRISPNLKLLSIDKRVGSKNIIKENAIRIGVRPSLIIEDEALNIFKENKITPNLLHPDRVIIGGGGSNSNLILEKVLRLINSPCIIVIPLISLKSISKLESILKPKVHKLSISQHQSYRGVSIGEDIRLSPLNPVFILKGEIQ
ncbi:precorrin-6Y C5,15-methyltransferase (decarboxylating) subunit CbiT [Prochlorococcus marinus]|uniref:precorrin-6Y C5,15-methyltransferase (decarboxylating) subunit CbiT n=1 Tax=Prochlorococcus marinus TaxID=1219 RepID=UPI0022B5B23B|nr:precorrin-6Y C5,15-methyltransferase (decarboxylating) subunit CbiT [Prochlorococcus marinus]